MNTKEGVQCATFFCPKIMFLKVFSETAHELMVMRKLPNAHPYVKTINRFAKFA